MDKKTLLQDGDISKDDEELKPFLKDTEFPTQSIT